MIRSLLFFFFFLPISLEEKIQEASTFETNFLKIKYYEKLLPDYNKYLDSTAYIHYKIATRFKDEAINYNNLYDSAIYYYTKSLQYFSIDDRYCKSSLNSFHLANCYRHSNKLAQSFATLSKYHYAISYTDYQDYLISFSEGLKLNNNDQLNLSLLKFIRRILSQPGNFELGYFIDNSLNLSNIDTVNKNPIAIKYLHEALDKVKSDDAYIDYKLILYNELGIRHSEYKNYEEAEKYYLLLNDPLDVNHKFKIRMHNNLADLYTKKRAFQKAIKHNRLAYNLLIQDTSALANYKAKNILGLSKIYFFQNNLHLALKYINESIAICPIEKNNLQESIDRMVFRYHILSKLSKDSFNLAELQKIDSLMDIVRKHQADAITKVEYRKLSIDFYKKASLDCINHNEVNEALYFKEKAKGILLAEDYLQLSNDKDIIKFKYFVDNLSNSSDLSPAEIENGFNQIKPIVDEMAEKYRHVNNINNQFFKLSIDHLITTNPPDHAYLDFFFTEDELLVFKITDKIKVHRIHLHPNIKEITNEYIDAIKNKKELCNGPIIYQAIIKPLGNLPPKLTIIADSYLSFLPFEALYSGHNIMDGVYKTYDFMIKKHNIKYNYSLSMQTLMQDKKSNGQAKYVFVPSFTKNNEEVVFADERHSLLPLKFAEEEAAVIGEYYTTTTYKGQEASKYNFLQCLTNAKFIHFAGHAIINSDDHHLSFLAFGPDDSDDQKLYLKDLSGLTTNAEMIVLSACETASGKYAAGEGLLSLGRAMVACGSKSVLTSLWNANDWSGKNIMTNFYQHLKDGIDKSEALYQAKKDYLALKQINAHFHPYHWSAFIIIGDDRPFSEDKWPMWIKAILGIVCICGAGLGIHRFNKRT